MDTKTTEERINEYEAQGWRYLSDATTWTGGTWYHNELGSVNNRGGSFRSIFDALTALDRFTAAFSLMAA